MEKKHTNQWQLGSWTSYPIKHQPPYENGAHLEDVLAKINGYPPLVFTGEVNKLKAQLASAARGERFVLQGGDCAERFQDCSREAIMSKIKILLQMSVVLSYGARQPVVKIGRIAGQYAKPRSNDTEVVDGKELPVFRGDNINSFEAEAGPRKPDPQRLLHSYHSAAMTLNYIRAMISGGFADLHHPEYWNLAFVGQSSQKDRYEKVVGNIRDAIAFMESFGGARQERLGSVDFFTSHEGLLLGLEQAQTRFVEQGDKAYNLGAHMLWIGDRTRDLGGAHIEYFRGIANPIGSKWGPSADPKQMIETIKVLNPENEAGKITIITRFGNEQISEKLPAAIKAVQDAGLDILWSSDPMHGNTVKTKSGIKTRNFDAILDELKKAFEIHNSNESHLGGVHFELTGEDVTECTGGSLAIREEDLGTSYETFCDPRLNYSQSLEMAFLISSMIS